LLAHCLTETENSSGTCITYNDDTWGYIRLGKKMKVS